MLIGSIIFFSAVAGYLIGSISVSIITSNLLYKSDVRLHGSGNAGATNMARVYGLIGGIAVLVGDFAKCIIAMFIGYFLGKIIDPDAYFWQNLCMVVAGGACLIGHAFPLYFKFKGGKGVSVGAALAVMFNWRVLLIIFAVFVIVFIFTKIVSVSSVCAALAFLITVVLFYAFGAFGGCITLAEMICGTIAAIFVIWLHRKNIVRLIRGEEKRFTFKKKDKKEE